MLRIEEVPDPRQIEEVPDPRQTTALDETLARRIRQLRKAKKLSQSDLARLLGISFQQMQKYEMGRNRIPASRLVMIARSLETTPHDLLQWAGEGKLVDQKEIRNDILFLWNQIQNKRYKLILFYLMQEMCREKGKK